MRVLVLVVFLMTVFCAQSSASLVDTVKQIKPSIVGVGVHTPLARQKNQLFGSGFVIGSGNYVVTNYHVISKKLDVEKKQQIVIFSGSGKNAQVHKAKLIVSDERYDLAVLELLGKPLVAMRLGGSEFLPEGSKIAFTGFPIGSVLGLYPVTHQGIISALTPTIIPVDSSKQLSLKRLKQLRHPYLVYQLDATAYPGNSGSAMYDPESGNVIGIINKVFVQSSKESVLAHPSGITYAIPVKYLHQLLKQSNIELKQH